jgi:hypothetical protein
LIDFRRLHDDLNNKCQDEKGLNSKLYELERKNVVLATENKEVREAKLKFLFNKKYYFFVIRLKENMSLN